ncbi:hypothetical protein BDQ12DRAFT_614645 [Crucibulum laeve]|uniref:Uncharacterized protein n=1 Tax=Crucibulum laeve TaxID=68775 RepID=A0A5C3LYH7_9AGAR|nr:hypothetical protein BDQ12DRAFT_614645 [Crucibulum laeve]
MNYLGKKSSNKHRLYLTLQHRHGLPGFHWGLVLAPKSVRNDAYAKDCWLFHATNSLQPGFSQMWRYEWTEVNILRSTSVIARLLVAKFNASVTIETLANDIHQIIQAVPVVQDDPLWTCRSWAEEALAILKGAGGSFGTIPLVRNGSKLENIIINFGEEAMSELRKKGKIITSVEELLHRDILV